VSQRRKNFEIPGRSEEQTTHLEAGLKNRQLNWKQTKRTDNSPGSSRSSKDNRELRRVSVCYELLPNYRNQTGTVKRRRTLKANVKELISFNTCSLKESCDLRSELSVSSWLKQQAKWDAEALIRK